MPIIDREGRVFALVNIVDLLALLVAIGVITVGDTVILSGPINAPVIIVVAVVGLATLVLASKWYHGVSWDTVRAAIRDAKPSWPSMREVRQRLTANQDSVVVVIDLRETITVGPIIAALTRILAGVVRLCRGSVVESTIRSIRERLLRIGDRSGISAVGARFFSVPSPPETNYDE